MIDVWQLITNFDAHLPALVGMYSSWVYVVVFAVVFLQIGILPLFFLPSNPFLFVCGAVWAASHLNLLLLLLVLVVAAVLGNLTGYFLGQTVGHALFTRYLAWPDEEALEKTRIFFEKHGEKGFLFSLFLPVIRTLAPFLAGVTHMQLYKFVYSTALGSLLWVLLCVMAGYYFGHIDFIQHHLSLIAMLGLACVVIAVLLKKAWDVWVKPKKDQHSQ
jgi:membrane-associated protein